LTASSGFCLTLKGYYRSKRQGKHILASVIKLLQSGDFDGCSAWAVIVIELASYQLNNLRVIGIDNAISHFASVMPLIQSITDGPGELIYTSGGTIGNARLLAFTLGGLGR